MSEDFVVITDYPTYKINSSGKIIHIESGLEVINSVYMTDYTIVALLYNNEEEYGKYVSVAFLVAKTFLDNPENKKKILFKDSNFGNISLSNLEWVS
jgi:hypothetical protein